MKFIKADQDKIRCEITDCINVRLYISEFILVKYECTLSNIGNAYLLLLSVAIRKFKIFFQSYPVMREESDGDKTYKYSDAQFIKETKPKQLPSSHGCSIRDHRPMYERIGDLLRARAERLRALQEKQKILDEELFTFKPVAFSRTKKNKSSRKKTMTDEGEQKEPVHVRLLNEGEKLLKRKKELFNKREDEISSMMTNVKPCHGSELILQEKYR